MARFSKVVIHFVAENAKREPRARKVVIRPGDPVSEIHLRRPVPPNAPTPAALASLVEGGDVGPGDGPLVCYMVNGELVCW